MTPSSSFRLESLAYQTDAVEAVVRAFEGTPRQALRDGVGNRCPLDLVQIDVPPDLSSD